MVSIAPEGGRAGDRVIAVRPARGRRSARGVHHLGTAGDATSEQAVYDAPFRGRDQVRHDVLVIAGEPVAGAAETGLDLVGDEDDAVGAAECGQPWQEAIRRDDEPALALHWLDDDRGGVLLAHLGMDKAR